MAARARNRTKARLRSPLERFRATARELLDLLQPPLCLGCRHPLARAAIPLCRPCQRRVPRISPPCPRCDHRDRGEDLEQGSVPCDFCRGGPPPLPVRCAGYHDELLRDLILRAKWHGDLSVLPLLADMAVETAREDGWCDAVDGWCPVPRDRWRLLVRGLPLSEHLGHEVGRRLSLPRIPPPRRRRRPPQVRLTGHARRRNLDGMFTVPRRAAPRVRGRNILVIDDVVTTGSTITAMAAALSAAGARDVRALAVSRVRC